MPPWTPAKARRATRSYAEFHKSTLGRALPRGLSRTQHHDFAGFWGELAKTGEIERVASLAHRGKDEAREWIDVVLPVMRQLEDALAKTKPPFALLHFDTRSDNSRLQGGLLRIFDWPFASAGGRAQGEALSWSATSITFRPSPRSRSTSPASPCWPSRRRSRRPRTSRRRRWSMNATPTSRTCA